MLENILKKYIFIQNKISNTLGIIIAHFLLIIIVVMIYSIINRYFLDMPVPWANELVRMLFGSYSILAIVYTQRKESHVRIEVLFQYYSDRMKALVSLLLGTVTLFCLFVFLYYAFNFAWTSWLSKEVSYDTTWHVYLYPFKAVMPIAILLLILQNIVALIKNIFVLLRL